MMTLLILVTCQLPTPMKIALRTRTLPLSSPRVEDITRHIPQLRSFRLCDLGISKGRSGRGVTRRKRSL